LSFRTQDKNMLLFSNYWIFKNNYINTPKLYYFHFHALNCLNAKRTIFKPFKIIILARILRRYDAYILDPQQQPFQYSYVRFYGNLWLGFKDIAKKMLKSLLSVAGSREKKIGFQTWSAGTHFMTIVKVLKR